jgi:hypothetical protein
MRGLKFLAMILAIIGGYLALSSAPASAAPFGAGAANTSQALEDGLVSDAQYYVPQRSYRRSYRPSRPAYRPRPVYRARPAYRPRPYYAPRAYRPRVVCTTRVTPFGVRRVCR